MSEEITQVYVVTYGCYSDYTIFSIWLTLEEAQAQVTGPDDGYGMRVEVWPIGENKRTLGTFSHSCDIDATTGETMTEYSDDSERIATGRAEICSWPGKNRLGIRVSADTQERADKVYSELRARVLANISTGLPPRTIATTEYVNGTWVPTADAP